MKNNKYSMNKKNNFILIFLTLLTFVGLNFYVFFTQEVNNYLELQKKDAQMIVNLGESVMTNDFTLINSDIVFLKDLIELKDVVNDNFFEINQGGNKEKIEDEFFHFALRKKIYDQIRIIDKTGQEIIRINYNDGRIFKVSPQNLQDKSERDYFKKTMQLNGNQIFVSELELNKENGEIEQPLKPVIRFSMPLPDSEGNNQGIIILNFLANSLIESFIKQTDYQLGKTELVDNEGYWIVNELEERRWGHSIKEREQYKFQNYFPEVWQEAKKSKSGQIIRDQQVFTFRQVDPLVQGYYTGKGQNNIYEIVSELEPSYIMMQLDLSKSVYQELKMKYMYVGIIFILLSLFITIIINETIAKKKKYRLMLEELALYDKLTEIPNRNYFFKISEKTLSHAKKQSTKFAIMYIDFDGFKAINDTHGHDIGDIALKKGVKRIKEVLREGDTLARLGGDEFIVIMPNVENSHTPEIIAEKIINNFKHIFNLEGNECKLGVSIGISLYPKDADNIDDLIQKADKIMYKIKRNGKNNYGLS